VYLGFSVAYIYAEEEGMITIECLEEKLEVVKETAEVHGKDYECLSLRRESYLYAIVIYSNGRAYKEFSPWMSSKEMFMWLSGFERGIVDAQCK
jgi:hypothetical protein